MPYDTGRHDRHTAAHQAARRHLRQGMATVALKGKLRGRPVSDANGRPLKYATEMMERHSTTTLSRWALGWSGDRMKPSQVHCAACKAATGEAWQLPEHDCVAIARAWNRRG